MMLWDWARPFLEQIGWPIFEGDAPHDVFNRSAAINAAARKAGEWDVALIADADTVQQVSAAHEAAEIAGDGLVIPWTHRIKLSAEGTEKLARHGTGAVTDWDRDKRDTTRPWGGGATVVVSRTTFEAVGGFDENFRGYGNEDLAFRAAVETLVGPTQRTAGLVWHLHHRPVPRVGTVLAATRENQTRWNLYRAANGKPDAMRELVR
jgi:hypothetical protein